MDLDSLIRTLEAGEGDCLKSEKIALQLEQGKRALDIRKELAPKISKLLSNAEQYLRTRLKHEEFKHKDKARLEHNLEAIINAQRLYKSGKRIAINNLTFFDPSRINIPKRSYPTNQLLTEFGNAYINPYALFIAGILNMIPALFLFSLTSKYANKAIKDFRTRRYLKGIMNAATAAGGAAAFVPAPLWALPYIEAALAPLLIRINYRFIRFILARKSVKEQMPCLEELDEIVKKQIGLYNKKITELQESDAREFVPIKEMERLNRYLIGHLKRKEIVEIADIDWMKSRFIGALGRADILTKTAEINTRFKQYEGIASKSISSHFGWVYVHEMFHLDGTTNEGITNFRTALVFEDIAVYESDKEYEAMLEKRKLLAAMHSFYIEARKALKKAAKKAEKKGSEDLDRAEMFYSRALDYFMPGKYLSITAHRRIATEAIALLRPGLLRKPLYFLQWLTSGSSMHGGYTIDMFKLLYKNRMF